MSPFHFYNSFLSSSLMLTGLPVKAIPIYPPYKAIPSVSNNYFVSPGSDTTLENLTSNMEVYFVSSTSSNILRNHFILQKCTSGRGRTSKSKELHYICTILKKLLVNPASLGWIVDVGVPIATDRSVYFKVGGCCQYQSARPVYLLFECRFSNSGNI